MHLCVENGYSTKVFRPVFRLFDKKSNERHSKWMISQQEELREVDISEICVNPFQPRRHFDSGELQELANSIKSVGLLHPPLVRLQNGKYELISGERRFRASQLVGLKKICVVIRHTDQMLSAQAALIENIQRVNLNPIEIAKALKNLIDQFGFSQDELSHQVGKKRSTVANYLRLLALSEEIQDSVSYGKITMGHAKAILGVEGKKEQELLHQKILKESLTVRDTEESVYNAGKDQNGAAPKENKQDCHLSAVANLIQQKLGTKVSIQGDGQRGFLKIDYYGLDDLDRLMSVLNIDI